MIGLLNELKWYKGALPMSYSRMNTLFHCPRQYYLQYVQKVRTTSAPADPSAAEAGILIHRVLELAVNNCVRLGYSMRNADYSRLFALAVAGAVRGETVDRLRALHSPAMSVLDTILRRASDSGARLATEQTLIMDYDWNPVVGRNDVRAAFIGYVDLIEFKRGELRVVDYKSEHFSEVRSAKTSDQTALYSYVLMRNYPEITEVSSHCAYLLDGDIVQVGGYTRSGFSALEKMVREFVVRYAESLRRQSWEASASEYCEWCKYAKSCKEVRHG